MSRRRIALPVLLVCALSLGGWLVFGPVWPRPARADPPIDIETPGGRARLDAALALARMPGEPWALPAASPAASAASDAQADGARCGEDQVPVFEPPPPDADGRVTLDFHEVKPAGVGYAGARRRVDAALRSSGDPFDQGVADALNVDDLRAPAARLEVLVQDAESGEDARLYQLAESACAGAGMTMPANDVPQVDIATTCARLDPRRWASLDSDNGVPWLYVLQQADQAGDSNSQREALQHLASASRFDIHFGMAAAAVARLQLPSEADLAAQSGMAMQTFALEFGTPFSALTSRCRNKAGGNTEMAAACETIAGALFEHSDSSIGRILGGAIHKQATGDATLLDRVHHEQSAYGRHWAATEITTPCAAERQLLTHMARVGAIGEVALMKEALKATTPP